MSKFIHKIESFTEKVHFNKKKKPQINKKKCLQIESNTQFQWLKFSCLSEPLQTCPEVISAIEELFFRNTNRKIKLKPWNPFINKNNLEFYLNVTKADSVIIFSNHYKIDKYRTKCYKTTNVYVPEKFPSEWMDLIKQVLSNRFVVKPETNETELDLSSFSDDKTLIENGLLLELSNPRVLLSILDILKTELSKLSMLNLSANNISSIYKLKSFLSAVNVEKINLFRNKISNIQDIQCLENFSILQLDLRENTISKKWNLEELRKNVQKYIPGLRWLNGQECAKSVLIAGENDKKQKSLPVSILADKDTDAYRFVVNYFSILDSANRDKLSDFYSTDSVLQMATFGDTSGFFRLNNSNFKVTKTVDNRKKLMKKGKAQILGYWANFPPSKHLTESLNVDITLQADSFMLIDVTGVFVELPDSKVNNYRPREFVKSMMIGQGGVILQEMLQVMPSCPSIFHKFKTTIKELKEKSEFVKSHKALESLSTEEIEMVRQFRLATKMNVQTCINFLTTFHGTALDEFHKLQSTGSVPKEAFVD